MTVEGVVYLVGYAVSWRPVFRWFVEDLNPTDGADVFLCFLIGTLMTLFWPVWWVVAGVRRVAGTVAGDRSWRQFARRVAGLDKPKREKGALPWRR